MKTKQAFRIIIMLSIMAMLLGAFGVVGHADTISKQTENYTLYTSGKLVIHKNADSMFDEHLCYLDDQVIRGTELGNELLTETAISYKNQRYRVNSDVRNIVIECDINLCPTFILRFYPNVTRIEFYKYNPKASWNDVDPIFFDSDDNRNKNYDQNTEKQAVMRLIDQWNSKYTNKLSLRSIWECESYDTFWVMFCTSTVKIVNHVKAENSISATSIKRSASANEQRFRINADASGGTLNFSSSNSNIAVTKTGIVTIKAGYCGSATITITTAGDAFYKSATKKITITVSKRTPKITASNKTYYRYKSSKSYQLGVKVDPAVKLTYSSDNKNVKVDSSGKVTVAAGFLGSATITIKAPATAYRNSATKKITVKVVKRTNSIQASNITTTYSTGKKIFSITASAVSKTTLTYKSNNSYIKVSQSGDITIAAGYVGKASITITASATYYYQSAEKVITVTVKDSSSSSNNNNNYSDNNNNSGGSDSNTTTYVTCSKCNGSGKMTCLKCSGKGWVYGMFNNVVSCSKTQTCSKCSGSGKVRSY